MSLLEKPEVLAVIMAPYAVRLRDPESVAQRVNQKLHDRRRLARGLSTDSIPDVVAAELVAADPVESAPPELAELPLATRSQLVDISVRARHTLPGVAGDFSAFYKTRAMGPNSEESLSALIDAHLLTRIEDPEVIWTTKATSLTVSQLRELQRTVGISHPRSALKAQLVALTRPASDRVLEVAGDEAIYELTPRGRAATMWIAARVRSTAMMWGAWTALWDGENSRH